jgi:prevent-host-death family protein
MSKRKKQGGERTLGISEFKSHCLALIDELQSGGTLVVTKRGKPVARVVAFREEPKGSTMGMLRHEGRLSSDIIEFNLADEWDAAKR